MRRAPPRLRRLPGQAARRRIPRRGGGAGRGPGHGEGTGATGDHSHSHSGHRVVHRPPGGNRALFSRGLRRRRRVLRPGLARGQHRHLRGPSVRRTGVRLGAARPPEAARDPGGRGLGRLDRSLAAGVADTDGDPAPSRSVLAVCRGGPAATGSRGRVAARIRPRIRRAAGRHGRRSADLRRRHPEGRAGSSRGLRPATIRRCPHHRPRQPRQPGGGTRCRRQPRAIAGRHPGHHAHPDGIPTAAGLAHSTERRPRGDRRATPLGRRAHRRLGAAPLPAIEPGGHPRPRAARRQGRHEPGHAPRAAVAARRIRPAARSQAGRVQGDVAAAAIPVGEPRSVDRSRGHAPRDGWPRFLRRCPGWA